jgi:hypothetical protein
MVFLAIAVTWVAGAGAASGLKQYVVPGQGISFSVPETWRAIDYRQARSVEQAERFVRGNPDFVATINALQSPRSPLKFVAIDPKVHFRTPGGRAFRASVNVIVTRASPGLTFERHRRALLNQLRKQLGSSATSIVDDVVTIAGQQAIRVRVSRRQKVDNVTLTILDTQLAFLRSGRGIYITYETVKELRSRYEPVFVRLRRRSEFVDVRRGRGTGQFPVEHCHPTLHIARRSATGHGGRTTEQHAGTAQTVQGRRLM